MPTIDRELVQAIRAMGLSMTMARLTEATEADLDASAGMSGSENAQPDGIPR